MVICRAATGPRRSAVAATLAASTPALPIGPVDRPGATAGSSPTTTVSPGLSAVEAASVTSME